MGLYWKENIVLIGDLWIINYCKLFLFFFCVVFTCTNASRELCSYTFCRLSTKKYSHNLWLSVLNFRKSSFFKNWRTYAPVNNDHKSFLFFWRFYMDKGRSDINLIFLCNFDALIYWSIHYYIDRYINIFIDTFIYWPINKYIDRYIDWLLKNERKI